MALAYLQYSAGPTGPFQTTTAIARVSTPPYNRGRADGYGSRIPVGYEVLLNGRWRRVYCCQWSNAGTCYIEDRSEGRKPHPDTGRLRYPWIVVSHVDLDPGKGSASLVLA